MWFLKAVLSFSQDQKETVSMAVLAGVSKGAHSSGGLEIQGCGLA